PDQARRNGIAIGDFLRNEIAKRNYSMIHVIGPSAGAWLAHRAYPLQNAEMSVPTLQATCFDAYVPVQKENLGLLADFAVQYVDTRETEFKITLPRVGRFGGQEIKVPSSTNATLKNS